MQIIKSDGTRKVYIFEDGTEIAFDDVNGYATKKSEIKKAKEQMVDPAEENVPVKEPVKEVKPKKTRKKKKSIFSK